MAGIKWASEGSMLSTGGHDFSFFFFFFNKRSVFAMIYEHTHVH